MNIRTGNSLDTGIARTTLLLDRAREFRIDAVARTDRNSLVGIETFLREARSRGIHAVAGVELDLASERAPGHSLSGAPSSRVPARSAHDPEVFPIVLYAGDEDGFINLSRLVTAAHRRADARQAIPPFITFEDLELHRNGLIAQSPGLTGEVSIRILRGEADLAERLANRLADVFGRSSLYLGISIHGRPVEARLAAEIAALGQRTAIPIVAANLIDHLDPDDAAARDLRIAIASSTRLSDAGPASHFRSPAELAQLFRSHPEALENAARLARRCNLPGTRVNFPGYPLPVGRTADAYLASLCDLDGVSDQRCRDRLDHELRAIAGRGLAGYFLVLRDLTDHARSRHILTGPGRGAVTSSAVAYRLGITGIDPILNGLSFERFLAAALDGPPEFGIEVAANRRHELASYLMHRHGAANVARAGQIEFYSPRLALQDAGQAMGIDAAEVAEVAAKGSDEPGADLAPVVAHDTRLARQYRQDERVRTWFNLARRLQSLPRGYRPHPSGFVLAAGPEGALPVARTADGQRLAQVAWDEISNGSWMKIDLPGRKDLVEMQSGARQATLFDSFINVPETISSHRRAMARLSEDTSLAPRDLRRFLRDLKPATVADLATAFSLRSLARNGRDLRDLFLYRRRGEESYELNDAALESVLESTEGLLVDQEQVVELAQSFSGLSAEEAEQFRRSVVSSVSDEVRSGSAAIDSAAISGADLAQWRHRFIAGAVRRGVSPARAGEIFLGVVHAGRVAPERASSVGEAVMLYQRAYASAAGPSGAVGRKARVRSGQMSMPWAGGVDADGWNYPRTGTDGPR